MDVHINLKRFDFAFLRDWDWDWFGFQIQNKPWDNSISVLDFSKFFFFFLITFQSYQTNPTHHIILLDLSVSVLFFIGVFVFSDYLT